MITIDEAAKKWSCSKNMVLSYVYKRYITGMCVDGETLLLPDIEKPYIPRKRIDGSLDYYRALLRTIQRERFIDEHILGISKEKFNAYIEELESAGYIKKWSRMQAYRDIFWRQRETGKMSASGVSADEILAKLKRLENF